MARFGIIALLVSFVVVAQAGSPAWMENLHNTENMNRAKHDQQPLELEDGLSNMAQKWADKLAEECKKLTPASHAPKEKRAYKDKTAGENIYASNQPDPETAQKEGEKVAVKAGDKWYAEISDYPWPVYNGQDLKGKAVGHFTQQVWKSSKMVGYGLGMHPKCERVFVVARYWPAGNMKGDYANNVLPPK